MREDSVIRAGTWVCAAFLYCIAAATELPAYESLNQIMDLTDSWWSVKQIEGARAWTRRVCENEEWFNRLHSPYSGEEPEHLQLWGPVISEITAPLLLRTRIRSTSPFEITGRTWVEVRQMESPGRSAMLGAPTSMVVSNEWRVVETLLFPQNNVRPSNILLCLGGGIPKGAVVDFSPLGVWRVATNAVPTIPVAAP